MTNTSPRFKGLNIRIPMIIPIKGRGFFDQRSTLPIIREGVRCYLGSNKGYFERVTYGLRP